MRKGWNEPRKSLGLFYSANLASTSPNKDLHISFEPFPDYDGVAKTAAGGPYGGVKKGIFTGRAENQQELKELLALAVEVVEE